MSPTGLLLEPLSALVSLGWGNSDREERAAERLETGFLLSLQPQTRTLTSMTHQHQGIPKTISRDALQLIQWEDQRIICALGDNSHFSWGGRSGVDSTAGWLASPEESTS